MKIQKIRKQIKKDKHLINKLIKTAIARSISALGTFVFNFVLAKCLNISDYGYFMLSYSILVGLGFFSRFGMSTAVIRFVSIMFSKQTFGQIKKLRRDIFLINISANIVLGLLLICFRSYIGTRFFDGFPVEDMLLVFAFALPFYSYQTIQSSFFKAYKRPELAPFFEIGLTTFLTGTIVAALAWIGLQTTGLNAAIAFLFSSIFVVFCGYLILSKITRKAEGGRKFSIEKYSGFYSTLPDYALAAITGYFLKFSPTIILGFFATGKDVGLYSLVNSTSFVINFVLWIVTTVYAPHFADYYNQGEMKKLKGLYFSSTFYMMLIAVPVFLVIIIFPSFILGFFGSDFIEAKFALVILACAQLFNVMTGQVNSLLNMTGHQRKLRNIVLLTACISIGSSLLLTPHYGYMGAVIATAIGLIFQNSMAFYHSNKYLGIDILSMIKKRGR